MGKLLARYKGFVADGVLDAIHELAGQLAGRNVLHVHTGRLRADVIASLARLGDHLEELGIQHRETTIIGTEEMVDVASLTEEPPRHRNGGRPWLASYEEAMRKNARKTFLSSDLVMVHGLQPLGLVDDRRHRRPWLWRCYANLVGVTPALSSVIRRYLSKYQGAIFSHASFVPELESRTFIVPPSIDPFSPVNESLGPDEISRTLTRLGIPTDRPMALQFLGSNCASEALEAVRVWKSGLIPGKAVLVLVRIGDGPEPDLQSEFDAIRGLDRNLRVVHVMRESPRELCALGWAAQVVMEPTNCRWPSLDLLDVLWKGTAALVSIDSGTAPFIREGCGFCAANRTELSRKLGELLEDSKAANEMGARAHLSIGRHHLIPRHLLDYLTLMAHFVGTGSRA